jgi:hypothetical protein
MTVTKQRGGAQVGWFHASWPLAGIEVAPGLLTISSLGSYSFAPGEVTAVEEVGTIPLLSQGIRIHHSKPDYPENVVFYPLGGRLGLLAAIRKAGFRLGQPTSVAKRGFPFRIPAVLALALLWNVLLFLEVPNFGSPVEAPGPYALVALAIVFGWASLLPRSSWLQQIFLRENRSVGEILSLLRLVQLVSGVMLVGFGIAAVGYA